MPISSRGAGRIAMVARDLALARTLFMRALERDPSSYRAALGIASMFVLERDFDSASRAFDAARNRTHDKDEQKFLTAASAISPRSKSGDLSMADGSWLMAAWSAVRCHHHQPSAISHQPSAIDDDTSARSRCSGAPSGSSPAASTARCARSRRSAASPLFIRARLRRAHRRRRRQRVHRLRDVVGPADPRPRAARPRQGAGARPRETARASARRARSKSSSASACAR